MKVLITVHSLDGVGGVQVYVRDLAAWLLARGHSPVVYGPQLGLAARQMRRLTIPVTDDLATIASPPDIIHGNYARETMAALLHFSDTPAVFVCHGWHGDGARPPRFPRVLRCVAVDETCADRLRFEEGVAPERLSVLLNGVDLEKYPPRQVPLPAKPRRAFVFGNAAHESTHLGVIREACRRAHIEVEVAGHWSGNVIESPWEVLGQYDLVFAKAKCAMEGMASGAAVILADIRGIGGLVRTADFERLRRLNFGVRTLTGPLTVDHVAREIAAYDADDAAAVSGMIRSTAAADDLHAMLLALYEEVIAEHAGCKPNWRDESRAAAAFLQERVRPPEESQAQLNLVVQATQTIFRTPIVGPLLARIASGLVALGRRRAK